jgi:hypothetical protein
VVIKPNNYMVIGVGIGALALLYLIKKPGAAESAGVAVGAAAVDMAGGIVKGVVTEVADEVGLPTPAETITDAAECKVYMDENGWLKASAKCAAPAFFEALAM